MVNDDTYCFFAYKNIYIERYSQGRVKTSACCINDVGALSHRIDFAKDSFLEHQREVMRAGGRPDGCAGCWHKEDAGTFSYRQVINRDLAKFSGDPYEVELLGIDYNVSPICNAKCIMCSSLFSSSWAAEDKKFGVLIDTMREYGTVRHNHIHDDLDLSRLQRIYFNGGEPLLTEEPLQMLERVAQAQGTLKRLRVSLNTNGSIFPSNKILDAWKRCDHVLINFSIDACGAAFEYIRNPLEWATVTDVVERLIELKIPNIDFTIAATVGIHNVFEIDELQTWVDSLNHRSPVRPIELVLQPTNGMLGLHNISDELKKRLRSHLDDNSPRLSGFMNTPRDSWATGGDDWQNLLKLIDDRRGLDWHQYLPRLNAFVSEQKKI